MSERCFEKKSLVVSKKEKNHSLATKMTSSNPKMLSLYISTALDTQSPGSELDSVEFLKI